MSTMRDRAPFARLFSLARPILFILPLAALLLSACATPGRLGPVGGDVQDLRTRPQNLMYYASQAGDGPLLAPDAQEAMTRTFIERFYAPWRMTSSGLKPEDAFWGVERYGKRQGYGENMLPRPPEWFDKLREACRVDAFPSLALRGVALRNTSLRVMPTKRPFFYDFALAGEGYPFDYFQNSALWVGAPVFISHATADGTWLFCETSFASGWVPAEDIGAPDNQRRFTRRYTRNNLAAVTRDNVAVTDEQGRYLFTAHVGAIFPLLDRDAGGFAVLAPTPHPMMGAIMIRARIPADAAAPLPLPLTAYNVARVGNAMLGQLYGWGGMYENRDCSAMVRDLFTPFGVWLPRNSKAQAQYGGRALELKGSNVEKEHALFEHGVPFATLVGMPGHIMLYIGQHAGHAVVFHNLWGLRTQDGRGEPGRYILGRAVITSLTPGRELPDLAPGRALLDRATSLTFVNAPGEP